MDEVWKPIKGYEGLYEVSNMGRVKSLRWPSPKILSPEKPGGYCRIQLYKNKKKIRMLVHRLVASAFIPNPYNKPEVNHIDGDKENNKVDNLEWVTGKENTNHAMKMGLYDEGIKKRSLPIRVLNKDNIVVGEFKSQRSAARSLGIDQGSISRAVHNESKVAYGYKFELINNNVNHKESA